MREKRKFLTHRLNIVSIGKYELNFNRECMLEAIENGRHLIFENCHLNHHLIRCLFVEYVKAIEANKIHEKFLWTCITKSTSSFPISFVRRAHKIAIESSNSMNDRILQNHQRIQSDRVHKCFDGNNENLEKIAMKLIQFHALIDERKMYLKFGWNFSYDFRLDLLVDAILNIKSLIEIHSNISEKLIEHIFIDCTFENCIFDSIDTHRIRTLFAHYFGRFDTEYPIEKKPQKEIEAKTAWVGLNANTHFYRNKIQCDRFLSTMHKYEHRYTLKLTNDDEKFDRISIVGDKILKRLPSQLMYEMRPNPNDSFEFILNNELIRLNSLITCIRNTMNELTMISSGQIMSDKMENIFHDIENNRVPNAWKSIGYPTMKSFSAYIQDLFKRIEFFENWLGGHDRPNIFWFSAFSAPNALVVNALRLFAKQQNVQFNKVEIDFQVEKYDGIVSKVKLTSFL